MDRNRVVSVVFKLAIDDGIKVNPSDPETLKEKKANAIPNGSPNLQGTKVGPAITAFQNAANAFGDPSSGAAKKFKEFATALETSLSFPDIQGLQSNFTGQATSFKSSAESFETHAQNVGNLGNPDRDNDPDPTTSLNGIRF